ncbi:MAG: DegT/DnrJ/EryC1/StrS family aminotransferase, partial [Pseudomonadota bacterium]
RADEIIEKKIRLALKYDEVLSLLPVELHKPRKLDIKHTYWMYAILVPENQRDAIMLSLKNDGVETRPVFYPIHAMPMYLTPGEHHDNAEELSRRGILLPSWPDLDDSRLTHIAACLAKALAASARSV